MCRVPFRGRPSSSRGNPSSTLGLPDEVAGTVQFQLVPAPAAGVFGFVLSLRKRHWSVAGRTRAAGAGARRDLILDRERQATVIDPLRDLSSQYSVWSRSRGHFLFSTSHSTCGFYPRRVPTHTHTSDGGGRPPASHSLAAGVLPHCSYTQASTATARFDRARPARVKLSLAGNPCRRSPSRRTGSGRRAGTTTAISYRGAAALLISLSQ